MATFALNVFISKHVPKIGLFLKVFLSNLIYFVFIIICAPKYVKLNIFVIIVFKMYFICVRYALKSNKKSKSIFL